MPVEVLGHHVLRSSAARYLWVKWSQRPLNRRNRYSSQDVHENHFEVSAVSFVLVFCIFHAVIGGEKNIFSTMESNLETFSTFMPMMSVWPQLYSTVARGSATVSSPLHRTACSALSTSSLYDFPFCYRGTSCLTWYCALNQPAPPFPSAVRQRAQPSTTTV